MRPLSLLCFVPFRAEDNPQLANVMYNTLEALRIAGTLALDCTQCVTTCDAMGRGARTLYVPHHRFRVLPGLLLLPVIPTSAGKLLRRLGVSEDQWSLYGSDHSSESSLAASAFKRASGLPLGAVDGDSDKLVLFPKPKTAKVVAATSKASPQPSSGSASKSSKGGKAGTSKTGTKQP